MARRIVAPRPQRGTSPRTTFPCRGTGHAFIAGRGTLVCIPRYEKRGLWFCTADWHGGFCHAPLRPSGGQAPALHSPSPLLDSGLRRNDEWGAGTTSEGAVECGHTRKPFKPILVPMTKLVAGVYPGSWSGTWFHSKVTAGCAPGQRRLLAAAGRLIAHHSGQGEFLSAVAAYEMTRLDLLQLGRGSSTNIHRVAAAGMEITA